MATDKRSRFVKNWYRKGIRSNDPFDKFFCFWIALVVSAQRFQAHGEESSPEVDDTDCKKIRDYFYFNRDKVYMSLEKKRQNMISLAMRTGTELGHPIIDIRLDRKKWLKEKFCEIVDHYTREYSLTKTKLVKNVAFLFNEIRNNLFHGEKVYDNREDIVLLEKVNPVLQEILENCEGFLASKVGQIGPNSE